MRFFILNGSQAIWLIGLCMLCGCNPASKSESTAEQPTARTDLPIRVAVSSGSEIAEVLPQAWAMASDQPLAITEIEIDSLEEAAAKSDVFVIKERWLGTVATERLVSTLPKDWVAEFDAQTEPLQRLIDEPNRWNAQRVAVSLGSPVPAIVTADDASIRAIASWQEWSQAVKEHSDSKKPIAAEPLANGWAAIMFLSRAASDRPHRWLFNGDSMEPALTMPEYVAALQQMVDVRKHYPDVLMTPDEVWDAIDLGELQLAVTIPSGPSERALQYQSLPNRLWPLTGMGQVACIASGCRQTNAARAFIRWLAGVEGLSGPQRMRAGLQLNSLNEIVSLTGNVPYDNLARERLDDSTAIIAMLRIPGAEEYYRTLNEQVLLALAKEIPVKDALAAAAASWQKITESYGVDRQYAAWMYSQDLPVLK